MRKLQIIVVIVAAVFNFNNVYATSSQIGTVVTYETAGDNFNLNLIVSGKGSVSDGEEDVRNQKKNYVLASMESKKYILEPDQGSRIEKVLLNDRDITTTIENNELVVTVVDEDVTVKIYFSAYAASDSNTNNESKEVTNSNIKTGDSTPIGGYIVMFVSVLGIGMVLYRKRITDIYSGGDL